MLWKLFGANDRMIDALVQKSAGVQDLSPGRAAMVANDDPETPPLDEHGNPRRLWLEGWNEKDEARLRSTDSVFDLVVDNG